MAITKLQPFNLDTTANYTFANITTDNANLGNAATANYFIGSGANLTSLPAGNISGQVANALVAGTVYTAAQPNITSVGTLSSLSVTGNLTAGNLIGPVANGNSNVNIPSSNGNINLTAVGNTTMVITGTGANIAGTLNVTGNLALSGANVTLGAVANLHISGGTNAYVLSTDGAGNLSWVAQSGGGGGGGSNIANGNSNVSIATANGNITMSAVGNANVVVVTGTGANIAGTLNVTGNTTIANLATTGTGGNISNVNVMSANTFVATGNITAGNATLGNAVTANFFNGNGIYLTSVAASSVTNGNSNVNIPSANGNINLTAVGNTTMVVTGTGANIAGTLNVTGNLTAGNFAGNLIGPVANGNSNVNIPAANGNINLTAVGNTTMVITGTGANIAGTLNVTGDITPSGAVVTRVVSIADGTSVTMNGNTTDLATQTNTQAAGTLTINAVSGTLFNGQKIMFRLQSANVQTFSWDSSFVGSTDLSLPSASSGSNKYDYMGFIYNTTASKWQLLAKNFGF